MGKGDRQRKVNKKEYDKNFTEIFGKKKLNIMSDEDKLELGIEIPYFNRLKELDKIIEEGEHQICGSHYEGTEDFRGSDY